MPAVFAVTSILVLAVVVLPREPEPAGPGVVDVGFCQDMAAHHSQAVLMAQQGLARSATPSVVGLATQILVKQSQERGVLSGWLTLWNAPQLPRGSHLEWLARPSDSAHHDHDTGHGMPGMATQEELDELGSATGGQFDILFLRLMIRHHEGGAGMAVEARDTGETATVRALAGAIAMDQARENSVMVALLRSMGGEPMPSG